MKKLFFVIVILSLATSSYAQLHAGFKAGINFSQLRATDGDQSETTDMLIGFQFGGYLKFDVSDAVSIQPELFFSRVGGKEPEYDEDIGEDISAKLKLDYFSIPVMVKFKLGENFNVQAGPQLGILVGAKAKLEFQGGSIEFSAKDEFNPLNFGLNVGIGFTQDKFGIDARYLFGISNLTKDSGDITTTDRVIQLMVSYRLTQ